MTFASPKPPGIRFWYQNVVLVFEGTTHQSSALARVPLFHGSLHSYRLLFVRRVPGLWPGKGATLSCEQLPRRVTRVEELLHNEQQPPGFRPTNFTLDLGSFRDNYHVGSVAAGFFEFVVILSFEGKEKLAILGSVKKCQELTLLLRT